MLAYMGGQAVGQRAYICREGVQVSQARNTTGFLCFLNHAWSLEPPILVIFEALRGSVNKNTDT